jgi:DNA-binding MurR/RpiR family transcriptional regulator
MRLDFITDSYGKLRASELKVGDYVLEHADEVIHESLSELAEHARVSDPTVIRFCRALGFKGFQDFKIHLAQSVIPRVKSIHEAVTEGEQVPGLVRKIFDANVAAVRSTLGTLDFPAVERAVEELARAKRIVFHGHGGSAVVAMDAYHKFFRVGIPCHWYDDGHMALMAAAMMGPGEFFVAISHSGSSRDVVQAVGVAKAAGASTLAIVSYAKSPLSKVADRILRVASAETGYRFEPTASRIAQLCVIDVLSVGVSLLRRDEVIANLNRTRKAVARLRY